MAEYIVNGVSSKGGMNATIKFNLLSALKRARQVLQWPRFDKVEIFKDSVLIKTYTSSQLLERDIRNKEPKSDTDILSIVPHWKNALWSLKNRERANLRR